MFIFIILWFSLGFWSIRT